MSIAFESEEQVAKQPDIVWSRMTDWKAASEWMPGIDSMAADGPMRVGTKLVFQARGKSRLSEITHLIKGKEVTLTSTQGPVSASYSYRCEPYGDGTRLGLVADCEIHGPLRPFGPLHELVRLRQSRR